MSGYCILQAKQSQRNHRASTQVSSHYHEPPYTTPPLSHPRPLTSLVAVVHPQADQVRVDESRATLTASLTHRIHPLQPALSLELSILQHGIVHLKIKEPQPIHPRWEVTDVIQLPTAATGIPSITSKTTDKQAVLEWKQLADNTTSRLVTMAVTVTYSPFEVSLSADGEVTVLFNARGLLTYEQYRERNPRPTITTEGPPIPDPNNSEATIPSSVSTPAPDADPLTVAYDYDVEGMWDESFGSHSDNKRYGPAAVAGDFSFPHSSHVYGIPEHASSFSLHSTYKEADGDYEEPYRLYNLDVFEYELNEPMALYGAVPYIVSHHAKASVGVLWLNSAETYIDVSQTGVGGGLLSSGYPQKNVHWISESGIIDVYLLPGPTPSALFAQYAALTGPPALPPYFAIAYHQCRWNYKSQDDVKAVDIGFDDNDIPYDVIWLDIEHTDGKKYFTWDSNNFAQPVDMQNGIAAKGRQMVTIVDPHMKRDTNYAVHTTALEKDYYVKTSTDGVYEGWCWPGSVSYLDFFVPDVRQYWADQFSLTNYAHSTNHLFTWNDMNEPSVFNGPEVTMPKDCRHLHGAVEHRDVHNMYGFYNHMATAQGLQQREGKRPFVLTRSFFAGSQRTAAVWTGDNAAEWSHLAIATPMLLSLNIAGITFSGADVGGFFKDPDAELLTRWYQAAAYQPFFRGHAHIDTKRREPWLFGEPYTTHIKAAIKQRYALLPYVYTLFYEAARTGTPVMRPLWVEFPTDEGTFPVDNQFMLGHGILVTPVTIASANAQSVYLPPGRWYDSRSFIAQTGGQMVSMQVTLDGIPILYRGGSIIPRRERSRRSSSLMHHDPLTLIINLNEKQEAVGSLYLDDGSSFQYQQGQFAYRNFSFKAMTLTGHAVIESSPSTLPAVVIERMVIVGLSKEVTSGSLQVPGEAKRAAVLGKGNAGIVIVRKPELSVYEDFTLTLA